MYVPPPELAVLPLSAQLYNVAMYVPPPLEGVELPVRVQLVSVPYQEPPPEEDFYEPPPPPDTVEEDITVVSPSTPQ